MNLAVRRSGIVAAFLKPGAPGGHAGDELLRRIRMRHGHDAGAVPTGPAERFGRAACDPERRMGPLHGPRVNLHVLHRPVLTLVTESLLRPGLDDHFSRFFETLAALLSRNAVVLEVDRCISHANAKVQ